MRTMKRILVPVDFSEGASEALELAEDLAARYEASITIIHVHELLANLMPSGPLPVSVMETWVAESNKLLDKTKAKALELGAREVDTVFIQGTPFAEIVRFSREKAYDLIVMGTHGRAGLKHALIGSVAEKVVRKAPCPVLTVRLKDAKFEHP